MFTIISLMACSALANPADQGLDDADYSGDDPFIPGTFEDDWGDLGIVGGTETSAYPETVSLLVGGGSCTATLITPEYVLTAAHCITEVPSTSDGVVVWGPNVNNPELSIAWGEYWVHPNWNRNDLAAGNDIAVIKLASPAEGMPVAILNDDPVVDEWVDSTLTFVGYGITSTGGFDSGTKRTTDNALIRYTSNLIYAFDENSGTCQGDSGGPSFRATDEGYLEQVGITSFGGLRCEEGEHGHTRVDVFIPWIKEIAPEVMTEPPPDDVGPGGGGGSGPGFLNWGITDDVNGLGGRFAEPVGGDGGGCSTAPGAPLALGWLSVLALWSRRRR